MHSNDSWQTTLDVVNEKITAENSELKENEEDNGVSMPTSAMWEEEHIQLDDKANPNTFRIFRGEKKVPRYVLTALFGELLTILGKNDNSVDFTYLNGRKGRVVI